MAVTAFDTSTRSTSQSGASSRSRSCRDGLRLSGVEFRGHRDATDVQRRDVPRFLIGCRGALLLRVPPFFCRTPALPFRFFLNFRVCAHAHHRQTRRRLSLRWFGKIAYRAPLDRVGAFASATRQFSSITAASDAPRIAPGVREKRGAGAACFSPPSST